MWFFVFNICMWFLCSTFVCGSLQFSMTLVCGFFYPSCDTIFLFLPLLYLNICEFTLHFSCGHA